MRVVGNPVRFSGAETGAELPPPVFAEHTAEVLSELLGRGAEEIEALKAAGVLA